MNGAGKMVKREGTSGMRLLTRLTFLVVLPVFLLSCSAHVPPSQQIAKLRDNILDAYGGRARLSQIQSLAAEGSITAIVREDTGVYRRAWRRDGKLFVDIQYTKSRETRILNGQRALRSVDGRLEDVSGPGAAAMIYQYNELSMPFALLDESAQIENRGRELINGVEVRTLRYTDKEGNSLDLFVNDLTHRIVMTTGSFSVEGQKTTLSSEYTNFRFVDGILLPFKIVNYAGMTRISETVIDDYLVNARLNDALFEPHAHKPQQ
jgi:hypothetical protein